MKGKKLLLVLICVMILSGCNGIKNKITDIVKDSITPPISEDSDNSQGNSNSTDRPELEKSEEEPSNSHNEDDIPILTPILNIEEGIREYLIGDWVFDKGYVSDVVCRMNIDEDLNVYLSFHDEYIDEAKGDFIGKIKLDRIYANANEAPDILSIELNDKDNYGGDFYFLHRTTYDEKFVMSWFFAGNGNSIFDILSPYDFEYIPEEIMFERISEGLSQLKPRKDDGFYGVFWGKGDEGKKLWIDDVELTDEKDYFARDYPKSMTLYENDVPESILYNILPDKAQDILSDDLFPGAVYFIQTDADGNIIDFIDSEFKAFIEDGFEEEDWGEDSGMYEIDELVFDIIENDVEEIKEYLNAGMSILYEGEIINLDGEDCYQVVLGTNHEESFVQEIFYAVNTSSRQVYRYDVITDAWELVID